MVFRLSFKTPDVTDQIDEEDREDELVQKVVKKFVKYGECIVVEFDTTNETARVVET